jgi:hypothetical protein
MSKGRELDLGHGNLHTISKQVFLKGNYGSSFSRSYAIGGRKLLDLMHDHTSVDEKDFADHLVVALFDAICCEKPCFLVCCANDISGLAFACFQPMSMFCSMETLKRGICHQTSSEEQGLEKGTGFSNAGVFNALYFLRITMTGYAKRGDPGKEADK